MDIFKFKKNRVADLPDSAFRTRKTTTGFTLIELLVVISIIGFLSSVVLASLQTARERAKATAFRAEVNQLINALELYKNDNGVYPFSGTGTSTNSYTKTLNSLGVVVVSTSTTFNFETYLAPYLKAFPTPTINNTIVYYLGNGNMELVTKRNRCVGDLGTPPYVILISNPNQGGFDDWVNAMEVYSTINSSWTTGTHQHCFSLK